MHHQDKGQTFVSFFFYNSTFLIKKGDFVTRKVRKYFKIPKSVSFKLFCPKEVQLLWSSKTNDYVAWVYITTAIG